MHCKETTVTEHDLLILMDEYDIDDAGLYFHGYRAYLRDYELIVHNTIGLEEPGTYSYLFRYCVEAHTHSSLSPANYRVSLDERLIDWDRAYEDASLRGYVWGTNWSTLYRWGLITPSARAAAWKERIGIEFHEVQIESNGYTINLVFSDLTITRLPPSFDVQDVIHHPWTVAPKE